MKKLLVVIALFAVMKLKAQQESDILQYINTYKSLAIQEMIRTGVPASITLAQGIHETSAGKSDLVLKSNNHFGIKCKSGWAGGKVYHDDDAAGECFRQYNLPLDSYKDHSDFLKNSPRYSSLFNLDPHNYKAWAFGLKKAGYATNIKYPQILIKLIEDYNLQDYTLIAMGEKKAPAGDIVVTSGSTEQVVVQRPVEVRQQKEIYPPGEFKINQTRVVYLPAGTSLLAVAEEYNIPYSRLLDFNDMKDISLLTEDQLIYLQRKRKQGSKDYHVVVEGESMFLISQVEGIRLEALAALNLVKPYDVIAGGEKLFLRSKADVPPILQSEVVGNLDPQANGQSVTSSAVTNVIPGKHIVQTKETLYSIAKKYGVELEKIQEWNQLNTTDLRIGQELVIQKN